MPALLRNAAECGGDAVPNASPALAATCGAGADTSRWAGAGGDISRFSDSAHNKFPPEGNTTFPPFMPPGGTEKRRRGVFGFGAVEQLPQLIPAAQAPATLHRTPSDGSGGEPGVGSPASPCWAVTTRRGSDAILGIPAPRGAASFPCAGGCGQPNCWTSTCGVPRGVPSGDCWLAGGCAANWADPAMASPTECCRTAGEETRRSTGRRAPAFWSHLARNGDESLARRQTCTTGSGFVVGVKGLLLASAHGSWRAFFVSVTVCT